MNATARKTVADAVAKALGSDDHIVCSVLFPTLPAALAAQVAREREAFAARMQVARIIAPAPDAADIAARVAYLTAWRRRRVA